MKSVLLSTLILPSFLLTSVTVKNNINVTTDTSGGSSSHTVIETTDNDKTTKVESNESGEIQVESINGQTKVVTSPGMKVNITGTSDVKQEEKESTASSDENENETEKNAPNLKYKVNKKTARLPILTQIENIVRNIFANFHLFFLNK